MREEIEVKVNYYDKGQEKTKTVLIGFVSNRVLRDYTKVQERLCASFALYDEIKRLSEKTAEIIADTEKGFIGKIKEARVLTAQIKEIEKSIKESKGDDITEEMFTLIFRLLKDNVCTDEDLLDYSFWDEKMTRQEPWSFLNKAVMKDAKPGKKKSTNLTNPC